MTRKLEKKRRFSCNRVISSHRIMCNASIESSYQVLQYSSSHTDELYSIYEDIMTPQYEKFKIQPCFAQSDSSSHFHSLQGLSGDICKPEVCAFRRFKASLNPGE